MAERPLSPHLQVYKLPYNAKLSIIGRGIGIGLAVATSVVLAFFIAVSWQPSLFEPIMTFLHLPVIGYLLIVASFPVFFYLANGVRHVLWDFVIGVHHEAGFKTGHIAIAVSALLTFGLAVCTYQYAAKAELSSAEPILEETVNGE